MMMMMMMMMMCIFDGWRIRSVKNRIKTPYFKEQPNPRLLGNGRSNDA